jgi:hypothetical protein
MAFRSSTGGNTPGASPVVATAPTGVALNDIILYGIQSHGDTPTWPSGFSATFATVTTTGSSQGRADTWVFAWKLGTASEPGTYSTSLAGGSGNYNWVVGCWSGRATTPGSPIITLESGHGSPATATLTGYVATALDDVAVFVCGADTNTAGSWATTNAIGYTTQQDANSVGTFRAGVLDLSTKDGIGSGATGNLIFTVTGSGLVGSSGGIDTRPPAPMYYRKNVLYFI